MKNNTSVTTRACLALVTSMFATAWTSVSAAALASTSTLTANFEAIARSDLLVMGPVELVDTSKARVQVLGQWIPLSKIQISQNPEGLVGHVLAVYGSMSKDGSIEIATVNEENSLDYVPGATRLYLKGSVSALDSLHGTARIGSQSVSYASALHTLAAEDMSVGAVVSFSGLKFVGSTSLYADNGLVHDDADVVRALGQTGSGTTTLGQTGSGMTALGQTGSGTTTLGQTGSGHKALGQTGSGMTALGQTGSGLPIL